MQDYRRMYAILCAAASAALDALPDTVENAEGRLLRRRCIMGRKSTSTRRRTPSRKALREMLDQ